MDARETAARYIVGRRRRETTTTTNNNNNNREVGIEGWKGVGINKEEEEEEEKSLECGGEGVLREWCRVLATTWRDLSS